MPYSNKHRSVHQRIRVLPGLCARSVQRNRPLYPYPSHPSMPDLARGAGEDSTRKASPFSCKPEDLWLELNRREGSLKDTSILRARWGRGECPVLGWESCLWPVRHGLQPSSQSLAAFYPPGTKPISPKSLMVTWLGLCPWVERGGRTPMEGGRI